MEDVLAVYQRPYDPKRPQVCLDEIQKALRSTPRGHIPLQPGQPRREDHELVNDNYNYPVATTRNAH